MVVGLLFGFRQKKQLQILALVNITTQLLLNLLLNIIHYNAGPLAFITSYVFFEVIVFALEAGLYCRFLKRVSPKRKTVTSFSIRLSRIQHHSGSDIILQQYYRESFK